MTAIETTPAMEAVAGALGGSAALVLTYPLQSISMVLQMHDRKQPAHDEPAAQSDAADSVGPSEDAASNSSDPPQSQDGAAAVRAPSPTSVVPRAARVPGAPAPLKRGTRQALQQLLQNGGAKGLYRGLRPALYGQLLIQTVYYFFFASARNLATRLVGSSEGGLHAAVCAVVAGSIGATATNPVWVVATRQIKTGSKGGLLRELQSLYAEEGLAGFFRGLGPALILVSNPTIQYGVFGKLEVWYKKAVKRGAALGSLDVFLLSAIAKIISTLCTYPYIMAKTTLQSTRSDDPGRHYTSTTDCLRGVYQSEGLVGLYSGLSSKLWHSVLTAALLFVLQARCLSLVKRVVAALRA